jgi:predicted nucleic acid-binding protein
MDYLLDPSWIINVLAGRGDAAAYHRNLPLDRVAASFVSVGEIYEVAFTYANPEAQRCCMDRRIGCSTADAV